MQHIEFAVLLLSDLNRCCCIAQAYYVNKEFRRALSVLNKQELFDKDVRFRYLAALCLAECSDWDECLAVIGAEDTPEMLKCKVCSVPR